MLMFVFICRFLVVDVGVASRLWSSDILQPTWMADKDNPDLNPNYLY
jgi:hypothetical protein